MLKERVRCDLKRLKNRLQAARTCPTAAVARRQKPVAQWLYVLCPEQTDRQTGLRAILATNLTHVYMYVYSIHIYVYIVYKNCIQGGVYCIVCVCVCVCVSVCVSVCVRPYSVLFYCYYLQETLITLPARGWGSHGLQSAPRGPPIFLPCLSSLPPSLGRTEMARRYVSISQMLRFYFGFCIPARHGKLLDECGWAGVELPNSRSKHIYMLYPYNNLAYSWHILLLQLPFLLCLYYIVQLNYTNILNNNGPIQFDQEKPCLIDRLHI